MNSNSDKDMAFCKTFSDCSHVTVLWNEKQGLHFSVPDDLWSLPHDQASEFLRRVVEGRPTPQDRQILDECTDTVSIALGRKLNGK